MLSERLMTHKSVPQSGRQRRTLALEHHGEQQKRGCTSRRRKWHFQRAVEVRSFRKQPNNKGAASNKPSRQVVPSELNLWQGFHHFSSWLASVERLLFGQTGWSQESRGEIWRSSRTGSFRLV